MDLIADIVLMAAALGATFYCIVLSRRLSKFTDLEKGVGGAIATLSQQVDDMTQTVKTAQGAANASANSLGTLTGRAEDAARRLELLVAAMHDLPDPEAAQASKAQVSAVQQPAAQPPAAQPAAASTPDPAPVQAAAPAPEPAPPVAVPAEPARVAAPQAAAAQPVAPETAVPQTAPPETAPPAGSGEADEPSAAPALFASRRTGPEAAA